MRDGILKGIRGPHGGYGLARECRGVTANDILRAAGTVPRDIAEAEQLYRLLMKSDPTDASAPFNLGNMLRAAARTVEAEAGFRDATRADPAGSLVESRRLAG
jgi:DNA-binding IscR family transcriptional regulator